MRTGTKFGAQEGGCHLCECLKLHSANVTMVIKASFQEIHFPLLERKIHHLSVLYLMLFSALCLFHIKSLKGSHITSLIDSRLQF